MRLVRSSWIAGLILSVAAVSGGPVLGQDKGGKPAAGAAAGSTTGPTTGTTTGGGWSGKVDDKGKPELVMSPSQVAAVKIVSGYFAKLENLQGTFVQTDPDKTRSRGKFFVSRPGKFRFNYGAPSRKIMASDGRFLRIQEPHQDAGDTVELDNTPFRLLLKKDVDLLRDAHILDVQESEDLIVLAMRDKSPDAPGRVQLYFSKKPEVDLKEWVVLDAQGLETRVEVTELDKASAIDQNIYVWEHKFPGQR